MKTVKIFGTALCAALLSAGCSQMPTIDKEYNPVKIDAAASSLSGTFRQGDEVTDAKIVLSYTNGLGREATVSVPETNGISGDPIDLTLAENSGTVEIPLHGVPQTQSLTTLRPTIQLASHEVFISFDVTPTADIVFDAAGTTVEGTFKIFQPVENGVIRLAYTSTQPYDVTIGVAELAGVSSPAFDTTLPAAPDGGTIDVPLTGTPSNPGVQNFTVHIVKGSQEYNVALPVTIVGELAFDASATTLVGDFVKGIPIADASVTLHYTADREMTMNMTVPPVDGISASEQTLTLVAGEGTVEIPLTGTPVADGVQTLAINFEENNIIYAATVAITVRTPAPRLPFEAETITYNGLTYNTVFVDVNGDGLADPGDVWLDRNIGATSNDPGTYGADGANPDAFGDFYQWGKPYGETTYDAAYVIDCETNSPWSTICPEGYEVPTLEQWNNAVATLTGGTVSGNTVTGVEDITEMLMQSSLGLPLSGWVANAERTQEQYGLMGTYWTASEGSKTAPWRFTLNNNTMANTGSDWADAAWQIPVRCIKSIE